MKKILSWLLIILIIATAIVAWLVLNSATSFEENKRYLLVYTGNTGRTPVMKYIEERRLLADPGLFAWLADRAGVWKRLKPGRYEIKKGDNMLTIIRMLRNSRQTPVKLVINKVRTKEELASLLGKNFEADSAAVMDFVTNRDSIAKLGVNDFTFMTIIIPNTYTMYWNTPPGRIFRRLKNEQQSFWNRNNRTEKAKALGYTPEQVYTIASVVEEETNKNDEKGNIASVYINRERTGMPLGADPTIKFALKDFSLKRIYEKYTRVESPYNTYRKTGLPPGPICTPSATTIDAVLNAPRTNYMYFVARNDFSGYHTFSTTYAEHLKHAKEYQKALDEYLLRKQAGTTKQQ